MQGGFFRINLGADSMGQLANVADHCRKLLLCLLVQWLNECLSKADWKYLRQYGPSVIPWSAFIR